MWLAGQCAQRASRIVTNSGLCISAASWAAGNAGIRIQLDVRRQVVREADGVAGDFLVFQRPLVGRRVNLAEVVDASIGLRGGACFHEVRNRDGREEADDGHDDHDFNQREAGLADVFDGLHFVCFLLYAV